jgi:hypothetical protein
LVHDPYGYRVTASGPAQIVLKELDKGVTSGKVSVSWKMKTVRNGSKKNGFVVLSSDEDGDAALCAGAWIGANQITLFENDSTWGNDQTKACNTAGELDCRLDVDLDLRIAKLTVNGETLEITFTEAFTSINYVGFGVHYGATVFSELEMRL